MKPVSREMKPVSRKKAKELKDAGWERETYFVYLYIDGEWIWMTQNDAIEFMRKTKTEHAILYAPTLDEVLEELSYDNLLSFFERQYESSKTFSWSILTHWLYTTMRSADKTAEVWIALRKTR